MSTTAVVSSGTGFERIGLDAKSPELKACTIGTVRKLQTKHRKTGFVLIVTQKGCPPCPPAKAMVKKTVGGKLPIVEVPAEDVSCDPLLDRLKVSEAPSIFYMKGRKVTRLSDGDRPNEDIAKDLSKLVSKK